MPIGTPRVPYQMPGQTYSDWINIYDRLYRERIIFLGRGVDDAIANQIIAIMLYLDSEDSSKPIYLYINSPGGSVTAGLAIYDTMRHIKSEVVT
ncbi:MAG: ATP-dependent Clp protease proteolytic subunit, partial [Cyanobacteria bacterium P01_F01_bin.143]